MGSTTKKDKKQAKKESKKEKKHQHKMKKVPSSKHTTQPAAEQNSAVLVPPSPTKNPYKKQEKVEHESSKNGITSQPAAAGSQKNSSVLVPPSPMVKRGKPKQLYMPKPKKQFIEDTNTKFLLYWCVDFPEKEVHKMFMATPLQGSAYISDSSKNFEMPYIHPANTPEGRNDLVGKSSIVEFAPDMDNIFHEPVGMPLYTDEWKKAAFVYMGFPDESYPDLQSWTKKLSEEIVGVMNAFGKNKKSNTNYFTLRHQPEFSEFCLKDIVPNRRDLTRVIKLFFNPTFSPFEEKDPETSMVFDDMVKNKAVIQKIFGPQGSANKLKELKDDIQIIRS